MAGAKMTTDHRFIRKWAEQRGGVPAGVAATETPSENEGVIKIVFTDSAHEDLLPITWDEFFTKFDQSHLAFLYQESSSGGELSRFFKFINRDGE